MKEKTASQAANAVNASTEKVSSFHKKIGNTTFIVTSCFNGDKKRDMASALVRLMNKKNGATDMVTPPEQLSLL